jgi:hypothetical protein
MSEDETQKSPWVWKAAIVALPVGLVLAIIIALALKLSEGPRNEMTELTYAAADFDPGSLLDSVSKLEDLLGRRNFEDKAGQQQMRGTTALIEGSLGPNNLGYEVNSSGALTREGKVWRNYWIEKGKAGDAGTVLLWTRYANADGSPSVAALLSVAEWMRGRNFEQQVILAFVPTPERLNEIASGEKVTMIEVRDLGQGSRGLETEKSSNQNQAWHGNGDDETASDWKLTAAWEQYRAQAEAICAKLSKRARETAGNVPK